MGKRVKKKMSKKKLVLISIMSLILIILIIGGVYAIRLSGKVERVNINRDDIKSTGQEPIKEESDVINIVLLGTDKSNSYDTAADSIIIATVNHVKGEIKLSSIMRDMTLETPGYGEQNINDTMILGGPELLLKTLNTNFNLQIDKFVQVNIASLPLIIDKLGGVEMEITEEEISIINSYISSVDNMNGTSTSHITSPGIINLNGTQATAYSRIRYTSGRDFKRSERQREVLIALSYKFRDITINQVTGIVEELLPLVKTNLTNIEIISISSKALGVSDKTVQQGRFPEDEDLTAGFEDGYYRMRINKEATTDKMHKFIYSLES